LVIGKPPDAFLSTSMEKPPIFLEASLLLLFLFLAVEILKY
jgi:hypothetical protein